MSRSLSSVVALLERLAPLELAEDWDNVGLLVEPSQAATRELRRLFLCIDLSESVLEEALEAGADFVLAYHPPIFRGLTRLRASSPGERVLVRALEAGLAVYSPHTALDSTPNGVNDWLARGVGDGRRTPLVPHASKPRKSELKLVVFVPRSHLAELRSALARELGAGKIGNYSECSYELDGRGSFLGNDDASPAVGSRGKLELVPEARLEMRCPTSALAELPRVIAAHHPYEEPAWDLYPLLSPPGRPGAGAGRLLELSTPTSLAEVLGRLKAHLGVSSLRVARAERHSSDANISSVAVCAGSGGALFEKVRDVDLFVTGEMRHHDVLAKLGAGSSVVLAEHTHTERGFLPELAGEITGLAGGELEVLVSQLDADPLRTV
ncbi:MAG TPA: Nif3-like dinuclear metal center hexameric protein [Polyangiaceae bacterium]